VSTEMLDVLSVLDAQDNPVLGNCTLVLGEVALEFKNGRSTVPVSKAPEVARCAKVKIPGYTGPVAPPVPSVSADLPSGEGEPAKVDAAIEYLREQGLDVPAFDPAAAPQGIVAEGDGAQKTGIEVPVGQEGTLEVRSEPVPEEEKVHALPEGFEALTPAGEARCIARTGSGTQCSNASAPGSSACGLGAHQEQVA
jgi:hypothetical protein